MKKLLIMFVLGLLLAFQGCMPATTSGGQSDVPEEETVVRYWNDTINFGITVKDGVMMLGSEKLYEAGVNCYNLFNQCVEDGFSSAKAKQALDVLSNYGIHVVRFNCGGYLADFLNDFFNNKSAYINLLAEICEYAETLEIGLIPSFFWLYHAVPDYYDEPLRSWGREGSKTIEFMRLYTKEIVTALKDYKVVFAWELGNEFNLSCDLPNAFEHMPALPAGSKRAQRTVEDCLSAEDVEFAVKEFAKVIKGIDDTGRMITTGNATLRPSQYNQYYAGTWAQDSVLEFKKITGIFTPEGVDTVSEHVYFTEQTTFGKKLSLAEYLTYATQNAKELGKAYFVGEWGGGGDSNRDYYSSIGNAFVEGGVQLCLLWNYNLVEGSIEHSFSAEGERGQMLLDVVAEMNAKYDTLYR